MHKSLHKILIRTGLIIMLSVTFVLSTHNNVAHAATDGRLIDDPVFDNYGLMSADDIQSFLNSFPNSCLKNYTDAMPSSDPSQAYFTYSGTATAAQIIRRVADDYTVNPRVILTKLQQEQSLVTGAAGCASWRYTGAMGFNCPEGSSCPANADNAGFSKQVTRGMWLLKISKERANGNLNWMVPDDASWFYGGPFTAGVRKRCGTCAAIFYDGYWNNVLLQTGATASLYNYTPHIPSSFPGIWEAWWGAFSTWAPSYSWSYAGQSSSVDMNNVPGGTTATWTVSAVNTGTVTWTNTGSNPVRLGTSNPLDRASPFCTASWFGCARAATLNEASVAPGQTGTFTFNVKVPMQPGVQFKEYFNLLAEGIAWMNDPGLYFPVTVKPVVYTWSMTNQQAFTDSTKTTPANLAALSPGQTAWLVLTAKNTGTETWQKTGSNPVRIGTWGPIERASRYATNAWISPSRPATFDETSVAPGGTATFEFPIQAPASGGTFFEHFNLLAEGITWMNDTGASYYTHVNSNYNWQPLSQAAYTDSSKATPLNLANLAAGQTAYVTLSLKNTGDTTWYNSGPYPFDLGPSHPLERISPFQTTGWLAVGHGRAARLQEASVAPGQTGTFEFNYKAPTQTGTYLEYYTPVAEFVTWLNDLGLNYFTVVH